VESSFNSGASLFRDLTISDLIFAENIVKERLAIFVRATISLAASEPQWGVARNKIAAVLVRIFPYHSGFITAITRAYKVVSYDKDYVCEMLTFLTTIPPMPWQMKIIGLRRS
jgi:hypothetical protein